MKYAVSTLLALFFSSQVSAYSNFLENPYTPYPAGCATLTDLETELYGDNVVRYPVPSDGLLLPDANNPGANLQVQIAVGRVLCAETNRSVVWIEFSIPPQVNPDDVAYLLRYVYVIYRVGAGWRDHSMRLVAEPNSWGGSVMDGGGMVFGVTPSDALTGHGRKWIFVVDNQSPLSGYFHGPESYMTPEQYNGQFSLGIAYNHGPYEGWEVDIPATTEFGEQTASIPLNGRLSGNWVADETRDQGFLISISELVGTDIPVRDKLADSHLVFFMSWYTFAADGSMLWLTGNADFLPGDTEVTMPIVMLKNGEFMGTRAADRTTVGSATISGKNCNELTFDFNLSSIGMGSGVHRLQRLYSLETAGYACRDHAARIATRRN